MKKVTLKELTEIPEFTGLSLQVLGKIEALAEQQVSDYKDKVRVAVPLFYGNYTHLHQPEKNLPFILKNKTNLNSF